jgi:hypothetical protein
VAKNYGVEYPERPLMAVLSDLLGITHFSTSRGSTVRSDFLAAVLTALGGHPEDLRKDELIEACVVAATGDVFDPALLSPGGTVTNEALQTMIDGVTAHGIVHRFAPTQLEDLDEAESDDFDIDFDPSAAVDERQRRISERAVREGQDHFRTRVLEAYGAKCALTGANAVAALDAAHIKPYMGPKTNVVRNGICLRADVHRLWDRGLVALDEGTKNVLIADALRATDYAEIEGREAALPKSIGQRPAISALRWHREWCGL